MPSYRMCDPEDVEDLPEGYVTCETCDKTMWYEDAHEVHLGLYKYVYYCDEHIPLPDDIIEKSMLAMDEHFPKDVVEKIKEEMNAGGEEWYVPYHFHFGKEVRNFLREHVYLDDKLPTKKLG